MAIDALAIFEKRSLSSWPPRGRRAFCSETAMRA
jgi:hypothetical protein